MKVEFKGKLGLYKIIETEDRTKTLWSEYFNEACHNLSGAYEETLYNYIEGCDIPSQIKSPDEVHVLDVGFGLGIGLKALLDTLKTSSEINKALTYSSIELDEDLFLWSIQNTFPGHEFKRRLFINSHNEEIPYYETNIFINNETHLKATIFIGDGRKTLKSAFEKKILPLFTAIFQDAFSPKKNPTLWTTEWFNECKTMSSTKVLLSTYSSSVSVRKSLLASGWFISNEKGFAMKRTMTKARLIGETNEALLVELSRSPTLELRDS